MGDLRCNLQLYKVDFTEPVINITTGERAVSYCGRQQVGKGASASGTLVKNPPVKAGDAKDVGLVPGQEDVLVKEVATLSSTLAWKIPWTEKPRGLQFTGVMKELYMTE